MVKYVHGKIGNDNMVIGMNVYGEKYNQDFVYYMKFFQRIQKRTDILRADDVIRAFSIKEQPNNTKFDGQVFFIGHSLSNADGDIIRLLKKSGENPDWKYQTKFIIYYCNQSDYERKVINLLEVFGKDATIQMINDKEIDFLHTSDISLL